MAIELDQGFSVGVETIDVGHRQIVRRVRQFETALRDGRPEEIRGALKFLHAYLVEHFANEERWMSESGYPAVAEHARIHESILDGIAVARQEAIRHPGRLGASAVTLAGALEQHMRSDDLKLGRFHTARQNLRLLAEAGPGVGASLTPIPGSLPAYVPPVPRRAPGRDETGE